MRLDTHTSPRLPRRSRACRTRAASRSSWLSESCSCLRSSLTTTIFFTSASVRHANSSNAGQKAYAIAEAGLNNADRPAREVLPAVRKPDTADAGAGSLITSGGDKSFPGGPVSWTGSFNGTTKIWTLTGTGKVANPTGGSQIVRTAKASVNVNPGLPLALMYGFFMGDPTAPCSQIDNSGGASLSVYVASCLTFGGAATIVEPPPGTPPTLDLYVGRPPRHGRQWAAPRSGRDEPDPLGGRGGRLRVAQGATTCNSGSSSQVWAPSYGSTANPQPLPTADPDVVYARANWSAASMHDRDPAVRRQHAAQLEQGDRRPARSAEVRLHGEGRSGNVRRSAGVGPHDQSEEFDRHGDDLHRRKSGHREQPARALYSRHLGDHLRQRDGVVPQRRLDLRPRRPEATDVDPCLDKWDPEPGRAADLGLEHGERGPGVRGDRQRLLRRRSTREGQVPRHESAPRSRGR